MGAFFEFIAILTFWLIYEIVKYIRKRIWQAAEKKAKEKDEEVFATFQEICAFEEGVRTGERQDEYISDIADEMENLFGENWKNMFRWNDYVDLGLGDTVNIHIAWENVACLYFAKRGKIIAHRYDFIPIKQTEIVTLYKRVEEHIRKKHSGMSLIFIPKMDADSVDGKIVFRENRYGLGKLMWSYYYEQFLKDPARDLTKRLW